MKVNWGQRFYYFLLSFLFSVSDFEFSHKYLVFLLSDFFFHFQTVFFKFHTEDLICTEGCGIMSDNLTKEAETLPHL